FILLGCGTVQVCTAAMHYGYRIVEDMIDGLSNWMDEKGFRAIDDFRGLSVPKITEWKHLDLNYRIVARINRQTCIGCDLCYIACWGGAHQCIHLDKPTGPPTITATPVAKAEALRAIGGPTPPARIPRVDEAECVGCNLFWLVCPGGEWIPKAQKQNRRPPQPPRRSRGPKDQRMNVLPRQRRKGAEISAEKTMTLVGRASACRSEPISDSSASSSPRRLHILNPVFSADR